MQILIERDELARAAIDAALRAEPESPAERVDIRPAHRGFRAFLSDSGIELSELAIVTLLQAIAYGHPVVLLPIVTLSRDQHGMLVTRQDRTVAETAGSTIGVRSWSQTTGVWVRGFMAHEAHVDLRAINWLVYEGSHVSEHRDPSCVRRAPAGSELLVDFAEDRLDYAIFGNERPSDPAVHAAIPDADLAARHFAALEGFVPANHVLATTERVARDHAGALCEMFDAMAEIVNADDRKDSAPAGFEALRAPLVRAGQYAFEQGVLPRRVDFDEIVTRSCAALRIPPSRLGG